MSDGRQMLAWIEKMVAELGPRRPGTAAEAQAAQRIAESLRECCDEVSIEPVASRHGSFFGLLKLATTGHAGAFLLTFIWPGVALFLIGFVIASLVLTARGRRVLDPLFPRTRTQNVVGTIRPRGERRNVLLFSGHHDSPILMPLWRPERKGYIPAIFRASVAGLAAQTLFSLAVLWHWPMWLLVILALCALLGLAAAVTLAWGVLGWRRPCAGANDNLSSVAVVIALGRLLKEERPKHTEVRLLSFGCEEEGYFGSRDFASRYAPELEGATLINMETVGAGELAIICREQMAGRANDPAAIALLAAAAREAGHNLPLVSLPFGGTDAVSFAEEGLSAVTLFGRDESGMFSLWHVEEDCPKNLEPECLERALAICKKVVDITERDAGANLGE